MTILYLSHITSFQSPLYLLPHTIPSRSPLNSLSHTIPSRSPLDSLSHIIPSRSPLNSLSHIIPSRSPLNFLSHIIPSRSPLNSLSRIIPSRSPLYLCLTLNSLIWDMLFLESLEKITICSVCYTKHRLAAPYKIYQDVLRVTQVYWDLLKVIKSYLSGCSAKCGDQVCTCACVARTLRQDWPPACSCVLQQAAPKPWGSTYCLTSEIVCVCSFTTGPAFDPPWAGGCCSRAGHRGGAACHTWGGHRQWAVCWYRGWGVFKVACLLGQRVKSMWGVCLLRHRGWGVFKVACLLE